MKTHPSDKQFSKEERKEYVKEQRKKFKKDPETFFKKEIIEPTWNYWKTRPGHALGTFILWVSIYYLIFGLIQAVNNDMIYCDSSHDQFDGKLMYTFNNFVEYYNEQALELQNEPVPTISMQQQVATDFFETNTMYCDYNYTRWKKESLQEKTRTISYGYYKILLKRK